MALHSWRSTEATIRAISGSPVTHAYLISHPIPADIKQLVVTITSRDQGYYGNPSGGSWTWFEASVARPQNEHDLNMDLKLTAQHKAEPEDFAAELQDQGHRLLPLPGQDSEDGITRVDAIHSVRLRTCDIPCRDWQTWSATWSRNTSQSHPHNPGKPAGLLDSFEAGDRMIIWARAVFPGWVNYVKEIRIQVLCGLDKENDREPVSPEPYSPQGLIQQAGSSTKELPNVDVGMLQDAFAGALRSLGQSVGGPDSRDTSSPISVHERPNSAASRVQNPFNAALRFLGQSAERLQQLQEEVRSKQKERTTWSPPEISFPHLPTFEYDTLPTAGQQEIRLLKILPSVETDEVGLVRAEIFTYQSESAPRHIALSYTWGEVGEYPVILSGKKWHVRANLLAFLLQVQQEPDHVKAYYWIDAVCINQANMKERGAFVARMKAIYEKAHSIIVWLGPGNAEVESSFDALDSLTKLHVFTNGKTRYVPRENEDVYARPDFPVLKERLLSHPYWYRVWILQEASTSKRGTPSFVWYGSRKRMFDEFLVSLLKINDHGRKQRQNIGLHPSSPLERLGNLSIQRDPITSLHYPPITTMGLLEHARVCRCTDDRDRIYALLSVASDSLDFPVDYNKNTTNVFIDLAHHMITKEASLDFLGFTDGRRKLEGLPSWIPDWTCSTVPHPFPKTVWSKNNPDPALVELVKKKEAVFTVADARALWRTINMYNASTGMERPSSYLNRQDPSSLVVRGYKLDQIASVDSGAIFADFSTHEPYKHACCSRVDALKTTASAGASASGALGMHNRTSWTTPDYGRVEFDLSTSIKLRVSWKSFLLQAIPGLKDTVANRTLFETSLGYIGLGSDRIQAGDSLCVIAGAQLPLVLRESNQTENIFEFCGEAYVHGVMDGEAAGDSEEIRLKTRKFVIR